MERRRAGIVYILSISIGMGGVDGGVGVHTFMGEGDHCVILQVQWDFRDVRIAWRVCVDSIQASQLRGLS